MKLWILVCVLACVASAQSSAKDEINAASVIKELNAELAKRTNNEKEASWAYFSNITDEKERKMNEVSANLAQFLKEAAIELRQYNWRSFQSEDLRRQFEFMSNLGYAALPAHDYEKFLKVMSEMEGNYAKVRVCDYKNQKKCDLSLEPEIEAVYKTSRDPNELEYYWKQFYDKAGTQVRSHFEKYIDYNFQAAKLNNYTSGAEAWLSEYEDENFEAKLEKIYEGISPLYEQIHGFVRYKLRKHYGDEIVSEFGPIPMHLLGNLWAQTWSEIADIVVPYPNKKLLDVTDEMVTQGYTPHKMFEMGDDFFISMNLTKLPKEFWDKSILEKPTDGRDLVCHASAWDFFSKDDVRIKQCTRVTQDQFFTVHHELGHIQYYLQYQHLPFAFRKGANPGFHEAVGDVLSLSVSTPQHLQKIGLLKNYQEDEETRINKLFINALSKIVFLPFAFSLDKYRWALFRNEIKKENWNCAFWGLRHQYSGIEPPIKRTENDFDPTAKYHVSADVEYLRYFISFIMQFQFYKSACITAGQYEQDNPLKQLDNCDIYDNAAVGKQFHKMLSLGASKPWPDVLEAFNGERTMNSSAILEYFKPLHVWLETENKKNGVPIGWSKSEKCIPSM